MYDILPPHPLNEFMLWLYCEVTIPGKLYLKI